MSFLSPYGAVLRAPRARAAFASSLAGRLCYGIVSLSLLLTLTAGGRGYRFAGLALALFSLAVVLASPLRARLVDRHGPRRALPPMAWSFAATLAGLALVPPGSGAGEAAPAGRPGLVTVAYSQARHDPAAVAWVDAALAGGSALGGLAYGSVTWKLSPQRRLARLATGLVAVLMPAALSPGLLVLALLVALAGMLVSPALATAYVLTSSLASPAAQAQAGNWVSSGYNAGSSAGSALSGQLVGRIPLAACLPVLAAPALLALVPLWRTR
jgi:predicted MFS family arabinose efflux permease